MCFEGLLDRSVENLRSMSIFGALPFVLVAAVTVIPSVAAGAAQRRLEERSGILVRRLLLRAAAPVKISERSIGMLIEARLLQVRALSAAHLVEAV